MLFMTLMTCSEERDLKQRQAQAKSVGQNFNHPEGLEWPDLGFGLGPALLLSFQPVNHSLVRNELKTVVHRLFAVSSRIFRRNVPL